MVKGREGGRKKGAEPEQRGVGLGGSRTSCASRLAGELFARRDHAERLLRNVRPGSIILIYVMYPANRTARDALPLVPDSLRAGGFEVVTVGRLMEAAEGRET